MLYDIHVDVFVDLILIIHFSIMCFLTFCHILCFCDYEQGTLRGLCEDLEIPFDDAMLRFMESRPSKSLFL